MFQGRCKFRFSPKNTTSLPVLLLNLFCGYFIPLKLGHLFTSPRFWLGTEILSHLTEARPSCLVLSTSTHHKRKERKNQTWNNHGPSFIHFQKSLKVDGSTFNNISIFFLVLSSHIFLIYIFASIFLPSTASNSRVLHQLHTAWFKRNLVSFCQFYLLLPQHEI